MSHERELWDQDVEELAEEIWTLGETGSHAVTELRDQSQVASFEATLDALVARGLATIEAGGMRLTGDGRSLAARQVRRHRLAEALFSTVLEIADDASINRTACVIEHVLDAAMTDSICTLLGHPRACPHGKPIPEGACCQASSRTVEPVVIPLDRLSAGEAGRIVYIAPRDMARLVRLSNLGITPGAMVTLQQRTPATVIRVGETTLAVEPEIAAEIHVKRAS